MEVKEVVRGVWKRNGCADYTVGNETVYRDAGVREGRRASEQNTDNTGRFSKGNFDFQS